MRIPERKITNDQSEMSEEVTTRNFLEIKNEIRKIDRQICITTKSY